MMVVIRRRRVALLTELLNFFVARSVFTLYLIIALRTGSAQGSPIELLKFCLVCPTWDRFSNEESFSPLQLTRYFLFQNHPT